MLDFVEIIDTDHHSFIIDVNLKDYFNTEIESNDKINPSRLNSSRLSHRKQFYKIIEEMLIVMRLDLTV